MEKLANGTATEDVEDGVDVLDILITVAQQRRLLLACTVLFGIAAMTVSLLLPPTYTSTARILPPQQQGSGLGAMLGQLGSIAGASASAIGLKNSSDLYIGMLQSRTVADNLITKLGLLKRYRAKTWVDARVALSQITTIASSKDETISIDVEDKDPVFAATLANAYVVELEALNHRLAITDASRRRLFFEDQLKNAKVQLANAEMTLTKTQEQTGILQPTAQMQVAIESSARLRATIASKEVELASMRTFAAKENPDLLRTEQEVKALQAQLAQLAESSPASGDMSVPTGKLPESGLAYLRAVREVKYYETISELLAKQFEMAKLDEARDSSVIQVLDEAKPSDRRSKPKRGMITIAGVVFGFTAGFLIALARNALQKSRQQSASKWAALALALKR